MPVFGFAVFSGAFLLFQVQPMLGKYVLPWFGGAPAVWTTCLLVFQVLLLAGYSYAYFSAKWLPPRAQVVLHLLLLLVASSAPIAPRLSWKPVALDDPTFRICALLVSSLGLPFLVLAASGPLLQHWFFLYCQRVSPFRLYALSNAGSLLALLTYPSIFETYLGRGAQVICWRVCLGMFALTSALVGRRVWLANTFPRANQQIPENPIPTLRNKVLWILLPACASLLLAAITNKICQDLPPLALLWILPLTVYLLSFVLCFSGSRFYQRRWGAPVLAASLGLMGLVVSGRLSCTPLVQICIFVLGLFLCCVVCHGEVFQIRPDATRLTSFYLAIATGGALGTVLVAIVAPRLFNDYYELHFGLIACGGLFLAACWHQLGVDPGHKLQFAWAGGAAGMTLLTLLLSGKHDADKLRIYKARNFYGVIGVYQHQLDSPGKGLVELVHGQVAHGLQFRDPGRARKPTLYYTPSSGVGRAFTMLDSNRAHNIGVVGLGAGTVAAYARASDRIRFYEINPAVEKAARTFFTFLSECRGQVEVVPGDARLSLEREASNDFDLLALDAFNSDSIPIHLLTREAFDVYRRHVKTNGIIALHISNMSLNLEPIVYELSQTFGYAAQKVEQRTSDETEGILASSWILLQRGRAASDRGDSLLPPIAVRPVNGSAGQLWTDDFNGLATILRWPRQKQTPLLAELEVFEPTESSMTHSRTQIAIERFKQALERDPDSPLALNNLACLLATASDPSIRNGEEAVRLAQKACTLTRYDNSSTLSTLAAAYAEAGRFDDAVAIAEKACALAGSRGESAILAGNQQMLKAFREKRAFHQVP